ncbi:MAG: BglG family transcription antiterminator [Beduini sp.]|uniref:BglG family transcription antiterminator n=1 Tax=Beduini sp. TaxID=1922300 RepID=UPI0011C9855D
MTQRQFMLIFLLWKQDRIMTSEELSSHLHVSNRTIKSEILIIQSKADQMGIEIKAKRGLGYQLLIIDDQQFQKELLPQLGSYGDVSEIPTDEQIRIYQTISILFEQEYVTADQIAASQFIDKRSLNKTFHQIRNLLQRYQLILISKANYGFKITGSELHQRFCIMDIYGYYHHITMLIRKDKMYQNYFKIEETTRRKIRNIWLTLISSRSYTIKDIHLEKFMYQLLLSYHRFQLGHKIEFDQSQIDEITSWESFEIVQSLKKRLHEENIFEMDESEVYYLSIVLFCYIDVHSIQQMKQSPRFYKQSLNCAKEQLRKLQKMLPTCSFPQDFINNLQFALYPLVVRSQYAMYEDNKWLRQWRLKGILRSLVSLELSYLTLNNRGEGDDCCISQEDVVQFSYTFQALLNQQRSVVKRQKILIIPSSGYMSALSLVNKIKQDFAHCIDSIEIKERYLIKEIKEVRNYDLLISSPEYCEDFTNQGVMLYSEAILNGHYQELYFKLMEVEGRNKAFFPPLQSAYFIELEEADSILDIFNALYGHKDKSQVQLEYQNFLSRENWVFNGTFCSTTGYFHFVEMPLQECFGIVKIKRPLQWKNTVIEILVICWIHPDSLEKCHFYDVFLNHLLTDRSSLELLWNDRSEEALFQIMKKLTML